MASAPTKPNRREAQQIRTRQKLFDAALAEYRRSGVADADIGVITAEADVARSTFYLHFPTKGHVMAMLEAREQTRMATELTRFLATPHDLEGALKDVIRLVLAMERRLGRTLFRELLAHRFTPTRPDLDDNAEVPIVALVVGEIERARDAGEAAPDIDATLSAVFFLLGLYSLLVTINVSKAARAHMLDAFVTNTLRGLQPR
ncbi:MAG: TetR/AcrR family transcriptional regulator [Streptomycetaceae bacterium]|nr:TetR/AcrR family transcriptional regulator [Streptomycetaceae bacterium]